MFTLLLSLFLCGSVVRYLELWESLGCGEVRDLSFGVIFRPRYVFYSFCGYGFFLGKGMSEYTVTEELLPRDCTKEPSSAIEINNCGRSFFRAILLKNFFRESARKNLLLGIPAEEPSSVHPCGRTSSVGLHERRWTFFHNCYFQLQKKVLPWVNLFFGFFNF